MDTRTLQVLKKDMSLKNIAAYIFNDDYVSDFLKQDLNKYKLRKKVPTINEEYIEKVLSSDEELTNHLKKDNINGKDYIVYYSIYKYKINKNGSITTFTTKTNSKKVELEVLKIQIAIELNKELDKSNKVKVLKNAKK
jgi:hypothetical protein